MVPLLAEVETLLLELLAGLSLEDWRRPTIVPGWTVHHVAAHLLDGALRKVAIIRDGHMTHAPQGDFVNFLNKLNADGVAVYSRLSPRQILQHLQLASTEFCAFHASLDPAALSAFPVSWAGESQSTNAFDTARELTERWHHQQQIRLATNNPNLTHVLPVLETLLRALPHRYRAIDAPSGTALQIESAGAVWSLCKQDRWQLTAAASPSPHTTIHIPTEIAWRLFTKGISPEAARAQSRIQGDTQLAEPFFSTIAIVG
jgi:uncharacterized protein (TIGR03083 family)